MMNVSSKSKFVKSAKSEVLKEQVTIATTSKIRDGVDCVDKDCAIMISPISNVEQMAGRICRHKEGKRQPSLIDIVDIDEPQIVVSFIKRFNFYKKKGWEVQFLYNDGIKTLKLTEESAKSIYGRELV
jgi:superfamily II DNA or RNA helicase